MRRYFLSSRCIQVKKDSFDPTPIDSHARPLHPYCSVDETGVIMYDATLQNRCKYKSLYNWTCLLRTPLRLSPSWFRKKTYSAMFRIITRCTTNNGMLTIRGMCWHSNNASDWDAILSSSGLGYSRFRRISIYRSKSSWAFSLPYATSCPTLV